MRFWCLIFIIYSLLHQHPDQNMMPIKCNAEIHKSVLFKCHTESSTLFSLVLVLKIKEELETNMKVSF